MRDSVLTADQKKARDDAVKAAKDAGKKGPEVLRAARAAVKLTDDQKAKMKEDRYASEKGSPREAHGAVDARPAGAVEEGNEATEERTGRKQLDAAHRA